MVFEDGDCWHAVVERRAYSPFLGTHQTTPRIMHSVLISLDRRKSVCKLEQVQQETTVMVGAQYPKRESEGTRLF